MTVKIGINGFGRIGRSVLRASLEGAYDDVAIVAVNDLGDLETNCHLLNYDSVHGRMSPQAMIEGDKIVVGEHKIRFSAEPNPEAIDWNDVDIVLECTGIFTQRDKAALHLRENVKNMLLSQLLRVVLISQQSMA